jgi:DNA invertase Pin-like site-specific DNA recombinase
MSPTKVRTCVLYVRISLSTEESVSIERQIEAGQQYAAARGWRVVGTFRDEGVSATHNKPQDRKGWQGVLAAREKYDAVVIWKVDRLARRVIDFLNANEAVKGRGAGIVAVEDPIDMTTAQGEAFAIMLAVFGQLEAATTRARVMAARDYLLRAGRYVGGSLPYGYRSAPNPDGAGFVIVHDAEQIGWVRGMVERTLSGLSIYSTVQWLDAEGAPTKNGAEKWSYNTVDRIVRHPLLAGMVPHNPGHRHKLNRRGEDVVRDENGLPVIEESLAVMPVDQWRAMQAKLAEPSSRRAPRAMRRKHSGVLSGLVWCGDPRHEEPVRMWRGTVGSKTGPRPAYTCKECFQTLSNAEDLIVKHFLAERGDLFRLSMVEEVHEGGSIQAREATIRLAELGREIVQATSERAADIVAEMARLKELQATAESAPDDVVLRTVASDRTYAEDWADAETDEERRTIIGDALNRIVVRRGAQGAWTDAAKLARCTFEWRAAGQVEAPTDDELATWAE